MQTLIPITQDLIRELRGRGLDWKAKELLQAHYRDLKQQKRNALLDHNAITRNVRTVLGMCRNLGCKGIPEEDKRYCERCIGYKRKWNKYYRMKRRMKK